MANITVIPASKTLHSKMPLNAQSRRKVAGYARVSTERRLRYLLGGTGGTALIIVGAANPHRTGGSNFSPVVLAAVRARDQAMRPKRSGAFSGSTFPAKASFLSQTT